MFLLMQVNHEEEKLSSDYYIQNVLPAKVLWIVIFELMITVPFNDHKIQKAVESCIIRLG